MKLHYLLLSFIIAIPGVSYSSLVSISPGQTIEVNNTTVQCTGDSEVGIEVIKCTCRYHNEKYNDPNIIYGKVIDDIEVIGESIEYIRDECFKYSTSRWYQLKSCKSEKI
jgi:hypothetical protein